MGLIRVSVTVEASWDALTVLQLMIGSENAADLASSTPVGGSAATVAVVGDTPPGSVVVLEHEHRASDKCATLPVGVLSIDAAGNKLAATEAIVQLADAPQTVGRPDVAATANPGEALLTWDASPDV